LESVWRFGIWRHRFGFRQHLGLAVGGAGGGIDDAPDTGFARRAVDVEGAVDVHVVRGFGLLDGTRDGGYGGQVIDGIGAGEDADEFVVLADIDEVGFHLLLDGVEV
jgi:hypothetical protein